MDQVEKELVELVANEEVATESDRFEAFRGRADKHFFATISGFISKSFFDYEEAHHLYCERATRALQSDLMRLGLSYQKVSGIWDKEFEKSFLVWNTMYDYEQFQKILLSLAKYYKQYAVCIGRKSEEEGYDIDLWETDSLEGDIIYTKTDHFIGLGIVDALKQNGTILTRKIHDSNGNILPVKTKRAIVFEDLNGNKDCAANDEYMAGFYTRRRLVKELESGQFNQEERYEFEQLRNLIFK